MLKAKTHNKVVEVNVTPVEELRQLSDNREIFCLDCNDLVIFKDYSTKQSHFSHLKLDCTSPFSEPESVEHETGKLSLYYWLINQYHSDECSLELKIDETNQRADTFVQHLDLAVEYQCSPIQASTWKNRVELYQSANISSIWILGYSMHTYYNNLTYSHKLNQLEKSTLEQYGKIVYYDVLTNQFIFLYIDYIGNRYATGKEYFFQPHEVFIKNNKIYSKYDYFIYQQKKRLNYCLSETNKERNTKAFISEIKKEVDNPKRELATKKQINYIKFLLQQNKQKIPYKFNGLKKEEASQIIKKLREN